MLSESYGGCHSGGNGVGGEIPVLAPILKIKPLTDRDADLGHKKWVSYLHRTATTTYPCSIPGLGEFSGSWSYKTYPIQR